MVNQMKLQSKTPPKSVGGFTLVEVLCGIAIAAIVIGALFASFNMGFAVLRATRDDLRATQILLQKTEAIRLYTWPQLSNAPSTFTEYYYPDGTSTSNAGTLYYGTLNAVGIATNVPDTAAYKSNLHLISISVSWTNDFVGKQIGHTRQMQTLNAFGGMQTYLIGTK